MSETTTPTTPDKTTSTIGIVYATLEAAKANVPTSTRKDRPRLFAIRKSGSPTRFVWEHGANDALRRVAEADGYEVGVAEPKVMVTKAAVASKLADFSDEELAALGLSRKKSPAPRK